MKHIAFSRALWLPCFIILFSSCKKFLEVSEPINSVVSSSVFSSNETATSAVLGLYGRMMQTVRSGFNGSITVYPGLSSDEIINTTSSSENDQFAFNSISSNNSVVGFQFWDVVYNYIYHANLCLEGLVSSSNVSAHLKNQLIGEVKFLRALCYFYLSNLFGDVPLLLSTDYALNSAASRSSSVEVYQQIIQDLKDAISLLPDEYVSAEKTRPNKIAATSFLARVYLYASDWENAEREASIVINSNEYELENNLDSVFLPYSSETIWQLETITGSYQTAEGYLFVPYPAGRIPTYQIRNILLNSFEANDKRKDYWIGNEIVAGQNYYYPFKYKVKFSFLSNRVEFNVAMRYSEILLIRAEARSHLNNLAESLLDLNEVRTRAGLQNSTASNLEELLMAISQERRVEFFAEWGHRWFDLKRTNLANDALANLKAPNWQSTDILYPIPHSQLLLNPNLTQNEGY